MFGDKIKVTILKDGSLKIETDEISMANHTGAEGLILELITRAGGAVEQTGKEHSSVYWNTESLKINSKQ